MNVATILKHKGNAVVSVSPQTTLHEVAQLLARERIGAALVLDKTAEGKAGEILGIVSERDIVKALAAHGAGCLTQAVATVMSNPVRTCRISDPIDHVMHLMTAGRFRHVPVVENRELKGVVSIGDVVKLKIAETELEVAAMRDYIAAH